MSGLFTSDEDEFFNNQATDSDSELTVDDMTEERSAMMIERALVSEQISRLETQITFMKTALRDLTEELSYSKKRCKELTNENDALRALVFTQNRMLERKPPSSPPLESRSGKKRRLFDSPRESTASILIDLGSGHMPR